MANGISVSQNKLDKKLAQFSNKNNIYPIEIPELIQLKDTPLPDSAYKIIITSYHALLKEMQQKAIEEKKWNKHSSFVYKDAQETYDIFSQYNESHLGHIFTQLNASNGILNKFDREIIMYENCLSNLPEFTLFHLIRTLDNNPSSKYISSYTINNYGSAHIFKHIELRHIEEILIQRNYPNASRIVADFFSWATRYRKFLTT
ncbi:hypothetical protein BHE89_05015 [Shigella sp. FC1967]|nr:hypothetical protein BHE89_05015 [Shigella sp. FC1967]